MWNKLFKKDKEILVVSHNEFTPEQLQSLRKATGKIVIAVHDMNSVKLVTEEKIEKGNGKAVFFGEGTEEEWKEEQNERKGFKGIFGL